MRSGGWWVALWMAASTMLAANPPLRVAFGSSLEPYVIEASQSGIEMDTIRLALDKAGYSLVPVFLPQTRLPTALQTGQVDAVATVNPDTGIVAAYSNVYVIYQDVAITLKRRGLQLNKPEDFARLRVLAFPNALQYLGEPFRTAMRRNRDYLETTRQLDQNRLLYAGGIDVAIADLNIFRYLDKQLVGGKYGLQPEAVVIHPLFPRIKYQVAFRNPADRDRFNQGLAQISKEELARIQRVYGVLPAPEDPLEPKDKPETAGEMKKAQP